MKKVKFILLTLCVLASIVPASAQNPMVELPWLPTRDTTGLRTLRVYRVDTLTGERKLTRTEKYDRYGFMVDSLDRLTYDAQGRLTEYVRRNTTYVPDNIPRVKESWRCRITYDADGIVERIENEYPSSSSYFTYEFLWHRMHSKYGLLDYTFVRHGFTNYDDIVSLKREYDDAGHLLRESVLTNGLIDGESDYVIRYRYDALGRRTTCVGAYYESADSMTYQYDEQGVLIGMMGGYYGQDMEADVVVRCRPDGTYIEKYEYWYDLGWDAEDDSQWVRLSPDKPDVYYFRYNEKDVLIYQKDSSGIMEYERDYWE